MVSLWMVVASLFFAIMGACVKLASVKVDFVNIVLFRSLINLIVASTIIYFSGAGFKTRHLGLHLQRAAMGNASLYCSFYTLIHLPIATATTLSYTHPIFQSLLTFFTAKSQLTARVLFSVVLGFIGIMVLLHPDMPAGAYTATLIGVLSGILTALAYFNVGKLVKQGEPQVRVVFYFSLVGTLLGLLVSTITGFSSLDGTSLLYLLGIGLFGTLGQFCMTHAYGHGNVLVVSVLSYSSIVFATLLGYFIFAEQLSPSALLGMLLITCSGAIAILKKSSIKASKAAA